MKRVLVIAAALISTALAAQNYHVYEDVRSNTALLSGTDMLCPTAPATLTRAPKGYKPFYISHYGRHGARYAWQSDIYDSLHDLFASAEAESNLTDAGKSFKDRFESLYPDVRYRVGDLSRKGWEQQQELAATMAASFPEVFKKGASVMARTSTSTRCIMTMSSFCLGLQAQHPELDVFENFGYSFLPAILPLDGHNPFRKDDFERSSLLFDETWEQYIERKIDSKAILDRLFVDTGKAVPAERQWPLVSYLYFFVNGMNSLDTDLDFTDIFTLDERVALWDIDNFQFFAEAWPTHLGYQPIVDDIIEKGDAAIAGGRLGADLRFGHDYTILPLLMILGADGMDHNCANGDEISIWCQTHRVPMGANIQLVFYRSKKNPEVLVKLLFNGEEAHLPLETDNWPYYSWNAFKSYYSK